jgi:CheY-like chemotaxis protein
VVDDDFLNYEVVQRGLIAAGPETNITRCIDGDDGVEYYQKMSDENTCKHCDYFKMIVMDHNMPKMNGHDATVIIKKLSKEKMLKNSWKRPVQILGYSAYDSKETIDEGFRAGMDYYLQKPYSKSRLFEAMVKLELLEDTRPWELDDTFAVGSRKIGGRGSGIGRTGKFPGSHHSSSQVVNPALDSFLGNSSRHSSPKKSWISPVWSEQFKDSNERNSPVESPGSGNNSKKVNRKGKDSPRVRGRGDDSPRVRGRSRITGKYVPRNGSGHR